MQLTRKERRHLRRTLFASTCALLGTTPALADPGDWTVDSGVLYYSEADRVEAVEPAIQGKRDFGDGAFLTLKGVVDTLTGPTPTGAMPSSTGNTVTSASGATGSPGQAGVTPLDPNFHDLRKALDLSWSQPFSQNWNYTLGTNYSIEHDFKSLGANLLLSRDFDRHNTTLSAGLAYEDDTISPIGGIHTPLSSVPVAPPPEPEPEGIAVLSDDGGNEGGGGNGSGTGSTVPNATKQVRDALVGLTQVMTHNWLAQLNFSYSVSQGYQNDPYKVVSILNTHLGGARGDLPIFGGPPIGEPIDTIYENRPDVRHKRAVYLGNKVYVAGDVMDFSYRYGWDDWGIKSSTYEVRYRWPFGDGHYLQPHLRYYTQTAADFYHRGLLDTDAVPVFVSADYRLAAFRARTVGLEFGSNREDGFRKFSVRLEYYVQDGGTDPHVNVGVQQGYDLFPELKATIVQFSYTF